MTAGARVAVALAIVLLWVSTAGAIRHYRAVDATEGETVVLEAGRYTPVDDLDEYTETWSVVRATCDSVEEAFISVGSVYHYELLFGASCRMQEAEEIFLGMARMRVEKGTLRPHVNVFPELDPRLALTVGADGSRLVLTNATPADGGTYFMYSRNNTDVSRAEAFSLTVHPADRPASTPRPPPRPVITNHFGPNIPSIKFVDFKTTLFHDGDAVRTSVTASGSGFPPSYSLEFRWLFAQFRPECHAMRIYEPCLFHPNETECLLRDGGRPSPCAVASTFEVLTAASRRYHNCTGDWDDCPSADFVDASFGGRLSIVQGHNPNLLLNPAHVRDSGLYVLLGILNGQTLAWTYVYLSTIDSYVAVMYDAHKPDAAAFAATPEPTPRPGAPGAPGLPIPGMYVLGACLALAAAMGLIAAAMVGARACVRACRRRRARTEGGIINAYENYSSLPGVEPYSDCASDGESDGGSPSDSCDDDPEPEERPVGRRGRPDDSRSGYRVWFEDVGDDGPDYSVLAGRVGGF